MLDQHYSIVAPFQDRIQFENEPLSIVLHS